MWFPGTEVSTVGGGEMGRHKGCLLRKWRSARITISWKEICAVNRKNMRPWGCESSRGGPSWVGIRLRDECVLDWAVSPGLAWRAVYEWASWGNNDPTLTGTRSGMGLHTKRQSGAQCTVEMWRGETGVLWEMACQVWGEKEEGETRSRRSVRRLLPQFREERNYGSCGIIGNI